MDFVRMQQPLRKMSLTDPVLSAPRLKERTISVNRRFSRIARDEYSLLSSDDIRRFLLGILNRNAVPLHQINRSETSTPFGA